MTSLLKSVKFYGLIQDLTRMKFKKILEINMTKVLVNL